MWDKKIPHFTYPNLVRIISKSDVVWFGKTHLLFPKIIFEIESTTDFRNSLLKMYQLLSFNSRFILVAPENKYGLFQNRMAQEPFNGEKDRFQFRSFEKTAQLYFSAVNHYQLRSQFLDLEA